jgi:hypothetical protein
MIDHVTARQALATSVDFSLQADEATALEAHLRSCAACRSFDASLRSDAAVLRDLDFGPVPASVRANVAIAAERRGGGLGRWFAVVAVGALLVVALGGGVLGVGGSATTGLGSNGNAVHWRTDVVEFTADDFWIDVSGKRFTASVPLISVRSDPGNATYRTLEATWQEHGVEMRLNLYFGGDETNWWVDQIRIYDGTVRGEWVAVGPGQPGWAGTWFKAPIGAASSGDLDLTAPGATLHIGGLTLRSMPFDGVNAPAGGGAPLSAGPVTMFEPGGPLHCSGILQMSPTEAEQVLLSLGYRLSWRYVTNNGGYWDPRREAPDGVIQAPIAVGSEGELIIPVVRFGDEGAIPVPFPDDCPTPGGSVPVPDRASPAQTP